MKETNPNSSADAADNGIAIIGLACRFPGASNADEFWRNIATGVESISRFSADELAASGLDAAELLKEPGYVPARGILERAEWLDAAFFGINPREAEVLDPQQRLFLEASWEALENAGYSPFRAGASVGVFAGTSTSSYYYNNLCSRPDVIRMVGDMPARLGNEKDFLATRIAYKLDLRGPAINVNTACSTSLVAVCQACQALRDHQCDAALAGGVSISFPQQRGTHYQEGGICSPDGHCRPFDAQAQGTVSSAGLGVVVLKRLADAVKDRDTIHAVIRGFGLNNDGSDKVGFTAPSVEGQAEAVAMAQAMAGFEPDTISYIEAHGTATPLGDPIEIAALTQAFRLGTERKGFCAIGSVKGNLGHTDSAAGVAGLIKTVQALQNRKLPPSLHFTQPNPKIAFANSPFYVNTRLAEWPAGPTPRRAGVSSFGLGGTNAHVVLEEAPEVVPSASSREHQLLVISARTPTALDAATAGLAARLKSQPGINLADAAYTLQTGRTPFEHRRVLICRNAADAIEQLESARSRRVFSQKTDAGAPCPVFFMFPGQGAQYARMGYGLYQTESVFREEMDHCAEVLCPILGQDIRKAIFSPESGGADLLAETRITQPALFTISYALARLWMSWGIQPRAMIGHSVGEYVAACLAGVFTLDEALALVARRAQLVQNLPGGSMLAVRLPSAEAAALLQESKELSLAAVNSPKLCVVSGPTPAIESLEKLLGGRKVAAKRLSTSHAFHSAMVEAVVEPLAKLCRGLKLNAPAIPYISNVTGTWITEEQTMDPAYWAAHLRQTVQFSQGLTELAKLPGAILLEAGPGQGLCSFARHLPQPPPAVSCLNGSGEEEQASVLEALGKLWLAGVSVDWEGFYGKERRRRIALPTYPFERKRFWIEPKAIQTPAAPPAPAAAAESDAPVGLVEDAVMYDATTTNEPPPPAEEAVAAVCDRRHNSAPPSPQAKGEEAAGRAGSPLPAVGRWAMGVGSGANAALPLCGGQGTGRPAIPATTDALRVAVPSNQEGAATKRRERILTSITAQFQEISGLGVETLTASARFAELGLDSLVLYQASHILQKSFGLAIAFRRLQEDLSSLGDLADFIDKSLAPEPESSRAEAAPAPQAAAAPPPEPPAAGESVILPLTDPQREVWLAAQAGSDASRSFNQVFAIHLAGQPGADMIVDVLQQLVDRHDALRTTFAPDGSAQRIAPRWKMTLGGELAVAGQEGLDRVLAEEDGNPFDLVNGPLFRARLLRLGKGQSALVLSSHHLNLDGWSMGVLLREFNLIYQERCGGKPASLPPAMQYQEFVQWRESVRHQALAGAAEAHWVKQFSTLPDDLDLPSDRPRPPVKTYRALETELHLDAASYRLLRQAAAAHDCTLFTVLLAGIDAWLFRLTGQPDLVVGVPAAGQLAVTEHPGSRSLVGHCVNSLPVRCQCEGRASFSELLGSVKTTMLDAYEHQNFTLAALVRKLNLRTDPSRSPLVSIMFNLRRQARAGLSTPRKSFNFFDLNLEAHDSGEDLRLVCRYNADLYDQARMERMLGHLRTLLEAAAARPALRLSELPLLTEGERRQILFDWNLTAAAYPKNRSLHGLVEEQVQRTPEAVAVQFEGRELTYRELDARANQLARRLRRMGVGPEPLVGICAERSLEMVVGLLGILKAGGAYVPMDPEYPAERLAFMLEDSAVPVLLTQEHLAGSLPKTAAKLLRLDADWADIAKESAEKVENHSSAENLAYMIYTSGSTGRPKGAMNTHGGIVNRLLWMQEAYKLESGDAVLQKTPFSFDVSVWEFFWPLLSGAKLVVARPGGHRDPAYLARVIEQERITTIHFVPSMLQAFLEQEGLGVSCASLKRVICSGEALPLELQRRFFSILSAELHNLYGPTEASVDVTFWACQRENAPGFVPIGRPIANTQIYILDPELRPVPIGVAGELHIGGVGLARGYYNRPKLTAEKFIANPFSNDPGARLYKTGDLARFLPDGVIEYLGRLDFQVKLRGFRIELGEIESVLNQHAGVRTSTVVAREDELGEKRLVAYLVSRNGPIQAAELQEWLRARLPDYMVPAAYVFLTALPLSPNGKVDRKALPQPEPEAGRREFAAPGTPTEVLLAKIWSEALGVERIGLEDNFFDLGGHSLLATRLISRIRKTFHIDLGLSALLQSPKLGGLAMVIDQCCMIETPPENSNPHPPPLSFSQEPTVAEPALVLPSPAKFGPHPTLTPLNARTEGPSLVLLLGQGSMELYNLAAQLKKEYSLHAVLAPLPEPVIVSSTRKDYASLPSMEEMATVQADLIKGKRLQGPLILTGFCFRGMLAYETARQLRAAGVEVAGVILLDTWMRPSSRMWRWKIWMLGHIRTALKKGPGYVWKKFKERVEFEKDRIAAERELIRSGSFDLEVPWVVMERIYLNAMRRYRPQPLGCRGVVIESKEDWWVRANQEDPTLGARALFEGGVEVLQIPGNHLNIINRQSVTELARAYRDALRLFIANNVPTHPQPRPGPLFPAGAGNGQAGRARPVDSNLGGRLRVVGGRSPDSDLAAPPGPANRSAIPRPTPSSAVPGPPLFLIPGLEGEAYFPPTMVRRIGSLRLCQDGLEYPGLRGREAPARQVEEIARHLIHQIQKRCPHGPYGLCGYSFGGTMAYEVACQMRCLGLEVDALILWDALPQRCTAHYRRSFRDAVAELVLRWRRRNTAGRARLLWQILDTKVGSGFRKIRGISSLIVPETPREICARASVMAQRSYQPQPYDGDLVLFRASELGGIFSGATLIPGLGWESMVRGKIEEFEIPGCHLDIREEPSFGILAQKTADWLRILAEPKQPVGGEMASYVAQG
jgi:amino acid adenylation domain-containing protein